VDGFQAVINSRTRTDTARSRRFSGAVSAIFGAGPLRIASLQDGVPPRQQALLGDEADVLVINNDENRLVHS
jgi:hypothetical protein